VRVDDESESLIESLEDLQASSLLGSCSDKW
jgi:hypothetical protein